VVPQPRRPAPPLPLSSPLPCLSAPGAPTLMPHSAHPLQSGLRRVPTSVVARKSSTEYPVGPVRPSPVVFYDSPRLRPTALVRPGTGFGCRRPPMTCRRCRRQPGTSKKKFRLEGFRKSLGIVLGMTLGYRCGNWLNSRSPAPEYGLQPLNMGND
jgi:hypothetical protein